MGGRCVRTVCDARRIRGARSSPLWLPRVSGHEVVAVSCVAHEDWDSSVPGHVCVIRYRHGAITTERVPSQRLHVWARAGRISFVSKTGETVNLTLLGEHEYEGGLTLGTPWPPEHRDSKVANLAAGAAHDLKNAVTFRPRPPDDANQRRAERGPGHGRVVVPAGDPGDSRAARVAAER